MHHNRQNRAGFVYFVQEEELRRIKIGFTTSHPLARIKTLRNASSQALNFIGFQLGDEKTEAKLHLRFKHLHRRAEWFDPGEDLLKYIDALSYATDLEKALRRYIPAPGDFRSAGKHQRSVSEVGADGEE